MPSIFELNQKRMQMGLAPRYANGPKRNEKRLFAYGSKGVSVIKETGQRVIKMVCSTEDEDRAQEVIKQDGWKLDNFQKNNVLLWCHESWEPSIGTCENMRVDGGKLVGDGVETKSERDDKAHMIFDKYETGELNAFSVGFIPLSWVHFDAKGNQTDSWWDAARTEYTECELLENSCVPVPCNQAALQLAFGQTRTARKQNTPRVVGYDGVDPEVAVRSMMTIIEKEGRVLSSKNRKLCQDAYDALGSVLGIDPDEADSDGKSAEQLSDLLATANEEIEFLKIRVKSLTDVSVEALNVVHRTMTTARDALTRAGR